MFLLHVKLDVLKLIRHFLQSLLELFKALSRFVFDKVLRLFKVFGVLVIANAIEAPRRILMPVPHVEIQSIDLFEVVHQVRLFEFICICFGSKCNYCSFILLGPLAAYFQPHLIYICELFYLFKERLFLHPNWHSSEK